MDVVCGKCGKVWKSVAFSDFPFLPIFVFLNF
jgi:hypothetical protein